MPTDNREALVRSVLLEMQKESAYVWGQDFYAYAAFDSLMAELTALREEHEAATVLQRTYPDQMDSFSLGNEGSGWLDAHARVKEVRGESEAR